MSDLLRNFSYLRITQTIDASATVVPVDNLARIPTATDLAAYEFWMTFESSLEDASFEIVRVVTKSGETGSGTITLIRAQQSSTASPHAAGTYLFNSLTRDVLGRITNMIMLATELPVASGSVASAGTSVQSARADHQHLERVPTGGTAGQVLSKTSTTNYDLSWAPPGAGPTGPAGLTWQGDWSALTSYAVDDAVQQYGTSYRALLANSNIDPSALPAAVRANQDGSNNRESTLTHCAQIFTVPATTYVNALSVFMQVAPSGFSIQGNVRIGLMTAVADTASKATIDAAMISYVDVTQTSIGAGWYTVYLPKTVQLTAGTQYAVAVTTTPSTASGSAGGCWGYTNVPSVVGLTAVRRQTGPYSTGGFTAGVVDGTCHAFRLIGGSWARLSQGLNNKGTWATTTVPAKGEVYEYGGSSFNAQADGAAGPPSHYDNFERADDLTATGINTAPGADDAGTWTIVGSGHGYGVSSRKIIQINTNSGAALRSLGTGIHDVSMDWYRTNTNGTNSLYACMDYNGNGLVTGMLSSYQLSADGASGNWGLYRNGGTGSFTASLSSMPAWSTGTARVRLRVEPATGRVRLWVNGVLKYDGIDANPLTGIYAGFGSNGTSNNGIWSGDNFLAYNASNWALMARAGVSVLGPAGPAAITGATAGAVTVSITVGAEGNPRYAVYGDGSILWGPGSTSGDIKLWRSAAGTLRVQGQSSDTQFVAQGRTGQVASVFDVRDANDRSMVRVNNGGDVVQHTQLDADAANTTRDSQSYFWSTKRWDGSANQNENVQLRGRRYSAVALDHFLELISHWRVVGQLASRAVAVFRGAASQTGALTEWQDSAGTVLAYASAGGGIYAKVIGSTGFPTGAGQARCVGGTSTGPPTTAAWLLGDWMIDLVTGGTWVCITAGTPGTWRYGGIGQADLNSDAYYAQDAVTGYDQEFGQLAPTTSLPSAWSWMNQGANATYSESQGAGRVVWTTTGSGQLVQGIVRASPSQATSYTVTAKIRAMTNMLQYTGWGLILRDSATGRIQTCGFYWGGSAGTGTYYANAQSLTSATVFGSNTDIGALALPTALYGIPAYFRMIKAGTSLTAQYSYDGAIWRTIGTATQFPATIDQIGFGHVSFASGTSGDVGCDWIRVRAAAVPTLL